jgi:hypothetical protein
MKKVCIIATLLLATISAKAQQSTQKSGNTVADSIGVMEPDTLPIWQMDGSMLHIIGWRQGFLSYTETIDGYTVVLDKVGIYEYAESTKDGDLVPNGTLARDPKSRPRADKRVLKKMPKHLRYTGEKLQKLKEGQNFYNATPPVKKKKKESK